MFWDTQYDGQLYRIAGDAARAKSQAGRAESELTLLRRRVERLSLSCQALWELLQATPGFTDETLRARMQEIDLRDGKADGRIATQTFDCPASGAKSNTRRTACIMCGSEFEKEHVFDT